MQSRDIIVSLDIDLDTIYSDPAPLEALIQRFGRINRRCKMSELAPVNVFTEPDDGQKIYDERLIEGTLKILRRENDKPINENAIGPWLDEIYDSEVEESWKTEFNKTADEFEKAVVETLRPFQSDDALKDLFYKAFDGIDLLPEDALSEYDGLIQEGRHIEARQLFVSISYGRFHQLKNKRLTWSEKGEWPIIVSVPYDAETGLDFRAI